MNYSYRTRAATPQDEPAFWEMLMYAAHETSLEAIKANADLVRYVCDFGRRDGDVGVVAEVEAVGHARTVGAAWLRLWTSESKGYGYVSDEIPELAIAVHPNHRARGIGTQLLNELFDYAKPHFSAISLSIRADNPALRLYRRKGFTLVPGSTVTNRAGGESFSMIWHIT